MFCSLQPSWWCYWGERLATSSKVRIGLVLQVSNNEREASTVRYRKMSRSCYYSPLHVINLALYVAAVHQALVPVKVRPLCVSSSASMLCIPPLYSLLQFSAEYAVLCVVLGLDIKYLDDHKPQQDPTKLKSDGLVRHCMWQHVSIQLFVEWNKLTETFSVSFVDRPGAISMSKQMHQGSCS